MNAIDQEPNPVKRAEERIRRILIDLEEEVGAGIEAVEVDTRQFAQLATVIHLVFVE